MTRSCAGLLLAAGGGRRLGIPKALVQVDGRRLVERGVDLLVAGGCAPVLVVLGAAVDRVRATCDLGDATVVVNEGWERGMGTSLRAGLDAMPGDVGAVVIALVDQPLVTAEAVRRLVRAWRDGAPVVAAGYGGAPRNPVLLDRAWWAAMLDEAGGDRGARGFLRSRPGLVTVVECGDTGSPADIDTPSDLAAMAGRTDPKETSPCS